MIAVSYLLVAECLNRLALRGPLRVGGELRRAQARARLPSPVGNPAADFRNSPLSITGIPQGTSGAEGLG
jgi:hypothetical protein